MKAPIDRTPSARTLLIGAAVLLVVYFALLPLGLVLRQALGGPDTADLIRRLVGANANWRALGWTVVLSTGSAAMALALGLPLAWLVTSTDLPGKAMWRTLFALPYTVPPYIGALAWTYLASGRSGWINDLLTAVLGSHGPRLEVYSATGIAFVTGLFFMPMVMMAVAQALERVDAPLIEAARLAGASAPRAWRDVAWPLVRPAALGGALLVFLASSASYGVPALLGPSARPPVAVLTTRIKAYVDLHTPRGFRQATLLCTVLMATSALFPLAGALGRRRPGASSRTLRAAVEPLGRWRTLAGWTVAVTFFALVVVPLAAIVLASVLGNVGLGVTWSNITLTHWRLVLGRPDVRLALANSCFLAGGAATVALAVGGLLAYVQVRATSRWRWVPGALASIPYATPGTVLAIGMILAFSGAWGPSLYNSAWLLLAAYTVKELALAHRMMLDGIARLHPSLEEAARLSGATWGRSMRDVVIPLLRGHMVAAWFLVFVPSFGELTMSILLFGPETPTVGTMLFELCSYEDPAAAAVLASIVVVVVVGADSLVRRVTGLRSGD